MPGARRGPFITRDIITNRARRAQLPSIYPSICLRCEASLPSPQPLHFNRFLQSKQNLSPLHRHFTTTTPILKSGGKQHSKRTVALNSAKTPSYESLDPDDFSEYESAIAREHEHLKSELSKVKAGGRDPEAIEGIKVQLKSNGGGGGKGRGEGGAGKLESARLGDLANVVPKGRTVVVMVGEKDHLKPVTSALQAPPHNLTPTLSPQDPLTLWIPVPPITQESRQDAMALASMKGEQTLFALREARGAQKKKLRAMDLAKKVGPDGLRRAEKKLEKINEEAVRQGKKFVEGCRRGLEGG